ncbi:MAG: hypothetical protein BWY22_02078 [Bacteroidetes bacterium ADurb.Bin217]|nr:MAG: hypothetical protein BWY22_02078 [Bacteroidetes bacterium ADurb.Bin217]
MLIKKPCPDGSTTPYLSNAAGKITVVLSPFHNSIDLLLLSVYVPGPNCKLLKSAVTVTHAPPIPGGLSPVVTFTGVASVPPDIIMSITDAPHAC